MVITCGDDRKIKIWDLRNDRAPVKILAGHSHWVWSAKYNPFHDQLIASGGTDNLVNLWRVASCSSAPWLEDAVPASSLFPDGLDGGEKAVGKLSDKSDSDEDSGFGDDNVKDEAFGAADFGKGKFNNPDRLVADPPDVKVSVAVESH
jgi:WD40 repeat protein